MNSLRIRKGGSPLGLQIGWLWICKLYRTVLAECNYNAWRVLWLHIPPMPVSPLFSAWWCNCMQLWNLSHVAATVSMTCLGRGSGNGRHVCIPLLQTGEKECPAAYYIVFHYVFVFTMPSISLLQNSSKHMCSSNKHELQKDEDVDINSAWIVSSKDSNDEDLKTILLLALLDQKCRRRSVTEPCGCRKFSPTVATGVHTLPHKKCT